jgi:translocation and assembly module TamB
VKRWLKWIAAAVLVALLALLAALAWLLNTESGARFALARALGATEGKLAIGASSGTLAGPLQLREVQWKDAGVDARIAELTVDIATLDILHGIARVENLQANGIDIALTTQPAAPPSDAPLNLQAPLPVSLEHVLLERIAISQDGQPVFAADRFSLAAWWNGNGLGIQQLALRAPDGEVDLDAEFSSLADYRGSSSGRFRWKVDGNDYAGTLKLSNDGRTPQLSLNLQQPFALLATIGSEASDLALEKRDWLFTLNAAPFDPKPLLKDSALKTLAFTLAGTINAQGGKLGGTLDLNDYRVLINPAVFQYTPTQLTLEKFSLQSPNIPGSVDISGQVPLGETAATTPAQLQLAWADVLLPAELAGQELASRGKLALNGTAQQFSAGGDLQLGPPDRPVDITLAVDGGGDVVHVKQLRLDQQRDGKSAGQFSLSGDITLKPVLGWKLDARASQLDPGAFAAEWPGSLNFGLASEGRSEDKGISATLKLDKLNGTLRRRPVSGTADLRIAPEFVIDGTLALASGESNLAVQGRGGKGVTDAQVGFVLASLNDVLPQSQGRLRGQFQLKGQWPALALNGRLDGQGLAVDQNRMTSLEVNVDVADISAPRGSLELLATGVSAGGQQFDRISLDGKGDRQSHELVLNARGDALIAQMQVRGKLDGENWAGTLNQLKLALKGQPEWNLDQPAALSWRSGDATLADLCLNANGPRLCIAGSQAKDGSAQGTYRIERLPLAMLGAIASPDATFRLEGEINGEGNVKRSDKGALSGAARLASEQGRIAYLDRADQPLLSYTGLAVDATLAPDAQRVTVQAQLSDGGRIDGHVTVSGPGQALSGQLVLGLGSISFVELFTTDVASARGKVDGRIDFAGTVAAPALSGNIALEGFAAEIPAAGLKLADGKVLVQLDGQGRVIVSGGVSSGQGRLELSGEAGTAADAPLDIRIEGKDFLAADIPAAHVVIGPKLRVQRNAEGLHASGEVDMPRANIDLTKLPGGGAAKTSPDVVVIDAGKIDSKDPLPVTADITLRLGDAVTMKGFGLDGKLAGQLVVVERPGRQTIGRGEIRASGTYKAYGQDLKIQTGRLLFAGTAIDNPGLDLRAVRELKDVTAGLRVQGTAQVPVLTVYSEPVMEQSEALSYLITGRPLSALKSGEGDLVGAAAQALGSATGDLLAKSIGARLGVDAAVSDNAAIGGAAFTVGKYLSPKLYLSYGVGIFTPGEVITLRYKLSRMWELEAQNATTENRAGLNYRLEK